MFIRCLDSNSRPIKHESSPITTRPGFPPTQNDVYFSHEVCFIPIKGGAQSVSVLCRELSNIKSSSFALFYLRFVWYFSLMLSVSF